MDRIDALQGELPYYRRLALSLLLGVPLDPAMQPEILRQLQSSYGEEPQTEGGTQAPRTQAQFGSMSRPEGTPAQERAG